MCFWNNKLLKETIPAVLKVHAMCIFLILNEYISLSLNAHVITAKTCTALHSLTFICGIVKYHVMIWYIFKSSLHSTLQFVLYF